MNVRAPATAINDIIVVMPILRTRLLFRLRSGKGRRGGGGHRQHTTCRAQLLRSTDCAVHAET